MQKVTLELTIDWSALSEQKLTLLHIMDNLSGQQEADMECILGLLDSIQDKAAEILGESVVFPNLEKFEECPESPEIVEVDQEVKKFIVLHLMGTYEPTWITEDHEGDLESKLWLFDTVEEAQAEIDEVNAHYASQGEEIDPEEYIIVPCFLDIEGDAVTYELNGRTISKSYIQ